MRDHTFYFYLALSLSLSHSHSTWKSGQQISLSVTTGHYNCTKFSKKMGSKALLMLKGVSSIAPKNQIFNFNCKSSRSSNSSFSFSKVVINHDKNNKVRRCSTTTTQSSLEPPDVSRLAETARISLTPNEVEEFAPKIRQVIDWFGQLQDVDLHSIEPSIRADTEDSNLRDDIPETFENRESMIAAVPSYEEPYIRVPKVLNKE